MQTHRLKEAQIESEPGFKKGGGTSSVICEYGGDLRNKSKLIAFSCTLEFSTDGTIYIAFVQPIEV